MSRKRNTYKNKTFFISLFIAGVAVAVLMGVTLVLGAGVQRAHGDISVGYVADNVNCTAQAWYQVSGSNTKTYFTDGNSNSTLSFSASSQAQTKNFISGNVTLNSDHDYCLVTFMFRNNAPEGGDDIRLSLTDSSVKTNIATYYYVRTYTPSTTLSTNYADAITGSTSVPGPVYIKPGNTIYYEIVIKIADLDYSASYSASSGNGILWLLENSEFSKSYQTVEYIESTGEQYIDTGVAMNLNTDAFRITVQATSTNQNGMIIGQFWNNNYYWLYHYKNGGLIGFYYTNTSGTQGYWNTDLTSDNINVNTYYYGNKTFKVNGSSKGKRENITFSNPYGTCHLFSANGNNYFYQGRIFYVDLWQSGVIQRSFIPVVRKTDNVAGLWDSVNEVFYDNDGSGTFGVGPATADFASDFVAVDYIESTGSQYIDTGLILTTSSSVALDFQITADTFTEETYFLFGQRGTSPQTTIQAGYNSSNIWAMFNDYDEGTNNLSVSPDKLRHLMYLTNNRQYLDSVLYGTQSITRDCMGSFYIFARRVGNGNSNYGLAFMKLFSMQIYNGADISNDFVPVRRSKDNKPGLYDKVTGTFYTNAGSGDFTLGPDAT